MMRWVWVAVCVLSSTIGDLASAKGMAEKGEMDEFDATGLALGMRYILTHKTVLMGILGQAISFFALLALLSVSNLSFAIPVTASSYVLKTFFAKWYLGECVSLARWMGVLLVAIGVALVAI